MSPDLNLAHKSIILKKSLSFFASARFIWNPRLSSWRDFFPHPVSFVGRANGAAAARVWKAFSSAYFAKCYEITFYFERLNIGCQPCERKRRPLKVLKCVSPHLASATSPIVPSRQLALSSLLRDYRLRRATAPRRHVCAMQNHVALCRHSTRALFRSFWNGVVYLWNVHVLVYSPHQKSPWPLPCKCNEPNEHCMGYGPSILEW